jgi:hypothetical protein
MDRVIEKHRSAGSPSALSKRLECLMRKIQKYTRRLGMHHVALVGAKFDARGRTYSTQLVDSTPDDNPVVTCLFGRMPSQSRLDILSRACEHHARGNDISHYEYFGNPVVQQEFQPPVSLPDEARAVVRFYPPKQDQKKANIEENLDVKMARMFKEWMESGRMQKKVRPQITVGRSIRFIRTRKTLAAKARAQSSTTSTCE